MPEIDGIQESELQIAVERAALAVSSRHSALEEGIESTRVAPAVLRSAREEGLSFLDIKIGQEYNRRGVGSSAAEEAINNFVEALAQQWQPKLEDYFKARPLKEFYSFVLFGKHPEGINDEESEQLWTVLKDFARKHGSQLKDEGYSIDSRQKDIVKTDDSATFPLSAGHIRHAGIHIDELQGFMLERIAKPRKKELGARVKRQLEEQERKQNPPKPLKERVKEWQPAINAAASVGKWLVAAGLAGGIATLAFLHANDADRKKAAIADRIVAEAQAQKTMSAALSQQLDNYRSNLDKLLDSTALGGIFDRHVYSKRMHDELDRSAIAVLQQMREEPKKEEYKILGDDAKVSSGTKIADAQAKIKSFDERIEKAKGIHEGFIIVEKKAAGLKQLLEKADDVESVGKEVEQGRKEIFSLVQHRNDGSELGQSLEGFAQGQLVAVNLLYEQMLKDVGKVKLDKQELERRNNTLARSEQLAAEIEKSIRQPGDYFSSRKFLEGNYRQDERRAMAGIAELETLASKESVDFVRKVLEGRASTAKEKAEKLKQDIGAIKTEYTRIDKVYTALHGTREKASDAFNAKILDRNNYSNTLQELEQLIAAEKDGDVLKDLRIAVEELEQSYNSRVSNTLEAITAVEGRSKTAFIPELDDEELDKAYAALTSELSALAEKHKSEPSVDSAYRRASETLQSRRSFAGYVRAEKQKLERERGQWIDEMERKGQLNVQTMRNALASAKEKYEINRQHLKTFNPGFESELSGMVEDDAEKIAMFSVALDDIRHAQWLYEALKKRNQDIDANGAIGKEIRQYYDEMTALWTEKQKNAIERRSILSAHTSQADKLYRDLMQTTWLEEIKRERRNEYSWERHYFVEDFATGNEYGITAEDGFARVGNVRQARENYAAHLARLEALCEFLTTQLSAEEKISRLLFKDAVDVTGMLEGRERARAYTPEVRQRKGRIDLFTYGGIRKKPEAGDKK